MTGHGNRPEDGAQAPPRKGLPRAGDVGIMDAEGHATLADRIKDPIPVSGSNVCPRVVEAALHRHPGTAAAVVAAIPDPDRGGAPAASMQIGPGAALTADALRAFLAGRLNAPEMLRLIELREGLPRAAPGRPSKKELRQDMRERAQARVA